MDYSGLSKRSAGGAGNDYGGKKMKQSGGSMGMEEDWTQDTSQSYYGFDNSSTTYPPQDSTGGNMNQGQGSYDSYSSGNWSQQQGYSGNSNYSSYQGGQNNQSSGSNYQSGGSGGQNNDSYNFGNGNGYQNAGGSNTTSNENSAATGNQSTDNYGADSTNSGQTEKPMEETGDNQQGDASTGRGRGGQRGRGGPRGGNRGSMRGGMGPRLSGKAEAAYNNYMMQMQQNWHRRYMESMSGEGGNEDELPWMMEPYNPRGQGRGRGRGMRGMPQGGRGGPSGPGKKKPIKKKASDVDAANMSMEQKIETLATYLDENPAKENPIQTLETALVCTHLYLKTEFDTHPIGKADNTNIFAGRVAVNDFYLGTNTGTSKKETKHLVFQAAIENLVNKKYSEMNEMQSEWSKPLEEYKYEESKRTFEKGTSDSLSEGLEILQNYVINEYNSCSLPSNCVSAIDIAISKSKCRLTRQIDILEKQDLLDTRYFYCVYYLNEVAMATGKARSKREAKLTCFKSFLVDLLHKQLPQIIDGVTVDEKDVVGPPDEENAKLMQLSEEEKFIKLLEDVKGVPRVIRDMRKMNILLKNCGLIPTCIFKTVKKNKIVPLTCDFFIGDLHIGHTEAVKAIAAENQMYKQFWKMLHAKTAAELIASFTRKSPDEVSGPDVYHVSRRTMEKTSGSNIWTLRSNPDDGDNWINPDKLVVLESHFCTDRKKNAFNILNYSAMMNGMLLEWETKKIPGSDDRYRVNLYLQKKKVSSVVVLQKTASKNSAALGALYKFYQTQPTIKIEYDTANDPKRWISAEVIDKEAEALKITNPEYADLTFEPPKEAGDEEEEEDMKEKASKDVLFKQTFFKKVNIDPFKMKAVFNRLEKYIKKESLQDIVFGPGINNKTGVNLRRCSLALSKLKIMKRKHENEEYFALTQKILPQKIVNLIKTRKCDNPKVVMVNKSTLPKYEDVAGELLKYECGESMEMN